MEVGGFVRIFGKHAQSHRYDYAVGYAGKIIEFHSMLGVRYATVRLVQHPPLGEPHTLLIPLQDLRPISEEQTKFQLIESR